MTTFNGETMDEQVLRRSDFADDYVYRLFKSKDLLADYHPDIFVDVPTYEKQIYAPVYLHKYMSKKADEYHSEKAMNTQKAVKTGFIGLSAPMVHVVDEQLPVVSASNNHVCLIGETGTGKELVAAYLHKYGPRSKELFLKINCASFPGDLIESILFGIGHKVSTGVSAKVGFLNLAAQGTIFFDEISKMPVEQQGKLLRVMEDKQFYRVGEEGKDNALKTTDFRGIFALNEDPYKLIKEGKLLKDFFYRFSTHLIKIPPLRIRHSKYDNNAINDIEILFEHFVLQYMTDNGIKEIEIPTEWIDKIKAHSYPGNVRELKMSTTRLLDYIKYSYSNMVNWVIKSYSQDPEDPEVAKQPIPSEESIRKKLKVNMDKMVGDVYSAALNEIGFDQIFFLNEFEANPVAKQEVVAGGIVDRYQRIEDVNELTAFHVNRIYKKHGSFVSAATALGKTRQYVTKWVKKAKQYEWYS